MSDGNEHGTHETHVDESATAGTGNAGPETVEAATTGPATTGPATATPATADPVARALAPVDEAMGQVRAAVSAPGATPTVPGDDEVAALEQAHEVLRSTLGRVDRGG